MIPSSNSTLSLILIALGILGVILSFLVPDRKKSLISIVLAAIIIVVGAFQFSKQTLSRYRLQKRMKSIQSNRQVDLEELRQKLKNRSAETNTKTQSSTPK